MSFTSARLSASLVGHIEDGRLDRVPCYDSKALIESAKGNFDLLTSLLRIRLANSVIIRNGRAFHASRQSSISAMIMTETVWAYRFVNLNRM